MKKMLFSLLLPVIAGAQGLPELSKVPGSPLIFAEGVISTGLYERDMAISPDGTEIFYTVQITPAAFQTIAYLRKLPNGKWTAPEIAPFSGRYTDLEPAFSSDGKKLYFSSRRPINADSIKTDVDLWVTEKKDGKWSEPKNLGAPVNTPADEYYPSVAANGNLYFTATYKKGIGREDIYVAKKNGDSFLEPVALDSGVNSVLYEFNAFISPDEEYIIFTSFGRKDDKGRGDLYISFRNTDGRWKPAKNMLMLNSEQLDYCPFVSFDKKILFFTSEKHKLNSNYPAKPVLFRELKEQMSSAANGGGNIYWVSLEAVLSQVK